MRRRRRRRRDHASVGSLSVYEATGPGIGGSRRRRGYLGSVGVVGILGWCDTHSWHHPRIPGRDILVFGLGISLACDCSLLGCACWCLLLSSVSINQNISRAVPKATKAPRSSVSEESVVGSLGLVANLNFPSALQRPQSRACLRRVLNTARAVGRVPATQTPRVNPPIPLPTRSLYA